MFISIFLFFFLSRIIAFHNLFVGYFDEFFFDHSLWITALRHTVPDTGHFSPILYLFSLPYLIYFSPLWMFGLQSLFVAGIAWLIYRFAQEQLGPKESKLVLILLLTNVPFRYMGFHDFHQDIVITFLLTSALYLLFTKNKILIPAFLMLCGFLAKEVAGLAIASFGIYTALFRKERILGLLLIVTGVIGTAFLVKEIIPRFVNPGIYQFSGYYSHFGNNIYEQIANMALHPIRTLSFVFSAANFTYLILLFAPLAFLPLFYPQALVFGILPLFENLLSNYSFQKDLTTQYSYVLLPVIFFSLVLAIRSFKQKGTWENIYHKARPCFIFFIAISMLAFFLLDLRIYIPTPTISSAHKLMAQIPAQAAVSASKPLIIHLQYRDNIYLFPNVGQAEYVVYDDINWWLLSLKGDDLTKIKTIWQQKKYKTFFSFIFLGKTFPDLDGTNEIINFKKNKNFVLVSQENRICLYKRITNNQGTRYSK